MQPLHARSAPSRGVSFDAAEIRALRVSLADEFRVSVVYDEADMSKPDAIEAMMRKAIAEFGAVDLLVNNAGIQHVAPVD